MGSYYLHLSPHETSFYVIFEFLYLIFKSSELCSYALFEYSSKPSTVQLLMMVRGVHLESALRNSEQPISVKYDCSRSTNMRGRNWFKSHLNDFYSVKTTYEPINMT